MQTRSSSRLVSDQSSNPTSSTNTNPKGRNRKHSKQRIVNSNVEEHSYPVVMMADQRTMAQLLQAPTEGYEDAIVVPAITADNFELKHGLLTLVQNKQFYGHDKEDPHAHTHYINKITSTLKFPNVPNTSIKLILFPFSLEGAARIWLEKEPPQSIFTWDDLVSKFINKFFPPSKMTGLRNVITNFQQRFDESFSEAWDRFKYLFRACPHHGFSDLHQLDTFYNALNSKDQDSLNSANGGNFLDKMPRDCLSIIESKSKVFFSRDKPVVAKVSTNAFTSGVSPDVAELKDMVKALLLDKKGQSQSPTPVKAVEESCVTCGGAHSYRNCPATDGNVYRDNIQEYVSQASAVNYNQGNTVVENEPEATKDTLNPTNNRNTEDVQPHAVQSKPVTSEPVLAPVSASKPNHISFEINFPDALILMPKFSSTLKALIGNKEKLSEMAQTPLNEHCSAVLLKRLPEKLGDPGKFLILCDFPDFDADPRIPLILGRSLLKTGRALIDVFKEYSQEVLGFFDTISSGNPTPYHDLIVSATSQTLTPFENSDFLLEEVDAFLAVEDEPTSSNFQQPYLDPEGDILLLEAFLNDDPSHPLRIKEIIFLKFARNLKSVKLKAKDLQLMNPMWLNSKLYLPTSNMHSWKGGFTIVENEDIELIQTRLVTGTFQRCMMEILHDMIEKIMKVFMDDFSIFGNSFQSCLSYLKKMLKRCENTNLCLNWKKSHFMVKEGIVLGHKISKQGIEVDKGKVDVIYKLPHPTTVNGIRNFLGHAGFYRRFIKDFSKIAKPMTRLLEKDNPFILSQECVDAF
nr:reverse transcriptase domain-containing protein [Tanacetum cinerariifolium]